MNKYTFFVATVLIVAAGHFALSYLFDVFIWKGERMPVIAEATGSLLFAALYTGAFTAFGLYKERKNKKG